MILRRISLLVRPCIVRVPFIVFSWELRYRFLDCTLCGLHIRHVSSPPLTGNAVVDLIVKWETGGENSQIDAWTNPGDSDIATITVGGNDIGFYDILTACILRVGGFLAGDCNAEQQKAINMMNDRTDDSLFNAIVGVLTEIFLKNGNDAFKIYMTGYPTFFNAATESCQYSCFEEWNPHYDWTLIDRTVKLTQTLRGQMNSLVTQLNNLLMAVQTDLNNHYQAQRVGTSSCKRNISIDIFCSIQCLLNIPHHPAVF